MTKFKFQRSVQFYETDMMKIVHHSNYLRWAEEARVAWGFSSGILTNELPERAAQLAVLETQTRHLKPCQFGDLILIELQVRREGIQIVFEYKIWKHKGSLDASENQLASEVRTKHVGLESGPDQAMRVVKPSADLKKILEKEQWTETWLSSL